MRTKQKKQKKTIAPRLVSNKCRLTTTMNLPPNVKAALVLIAGDEKKSVSWVMENVVIDYFDMEKPKYKEKKK